jgi:hypothetical protein
MMAKRHDDQPLRVPSPTCPPHPRLPTDMLRPTRAPCSPPRAARPPPGRLSPRARQRSWSQRLRVPLSVKAQWANGCSGGQGVRDSVFLRKGPRAQTPWARAFVADRTPDGVGPDPTGHGASDEDALRVNDARDAHDALPCGDSPTGRPISRREDSEGAARVDSGCGGIRRERERTSLVRFVHAHGGFPRGGLRPSPPPVGVRIRASPPACESTGVSSRRSARKPAAAHSRCDTRIPTRRTAAALSPS